MSEAEDVGTLLAALEDYSPENVRTIRALLATRDGEARLVALLASKDEWTRRGNAVDALTSGLQDGTLAEEKVSAVVSKAVRAGYGSVEVMSLLLVLRTAGDPRAARLMLAAQSGDDGSVQEVLREFD